MLPARLLLTLFLVLLTASPLLAQTLQTPEGLIGRAGDRSITLHWNPVAGVTRYRVYRSEAIGSEVTELRQSPVKTPSIADLDVNNGQSYFYFVRAEHSSRLSEPSPPVSLTPQPFASDDEFLEYLQAAAFDFFWFEANPTNGLIRDRTQPSSPVSIAAVGFGLSALCIGVDHGWITRDQAADRVLRTLQTFYHAPQGPAKTGTIGHKGWFYHFLHLDTATRFRNSELSSIDTALLLAGVLDAHQFFTNQTEQEKSIRSLADQIFDRIDWQWMLNGGDTLTMGWHPESGFISARWTGYNEASILYLLGLGAKEPNALEPKHWEAWTKTYQWRSSYGYSFIHFAPLFGHQYSACWIDFREIADDYTARRGITYFENSRRATLAQREYCIDNPQKFPGYSADIWGLTACDGPGRNGIHGYIARGAPPPENDDGTIAPTAAGGSLPFAPRECIAALRAMYDRYREQIWCSYGFRDAFNLKVNWWDEDVLGIDQGPILIMAENFRTGRVWKRMKESEVLQRGLKRAGFRPFKSETPPQN
jgi:hypothetical protein